MQNPIQLTTMIAHLKDSFSYSRLRHCAFLISLAVGLICVAPSSPIQAACQEGCLVNENTVLGDDALLNVTQLGGGNTAIGFNALVSDTIGSSSARRLVRAPSLAILAQSKTSRLGQLRSVQIRLAAATQAVGAFALSENNTGGGNTAVGDGALTYNTTGGGNTAIAVRRWRRTPTATPTRPLEYTHYPRIQPAVSIRPAA